MDYRNKQNHNIEVQKIIKAEFEWRMDLLLQNIETLFEWELEILSQKFQILENRISALEKS